MRQKRLLRLWFVISQIEREALAIIFGLKKFHQFLHGRKFCLVTDHKPVCAIFSPKKQLPIFTAQRLQSYAITLMANQFDIQYKPTKDHGNADGLSRLSTQQHGKFDKIEDREKAKILRYIQKAKLCKAQDSNKIQNFKNFSTYTTLISYHSIIGIS